MSIFIAMAPSTLNKNMFIADYSEVWPSFHETAGDTVLFPTLKKSPNDFVNLLILRGNLTSH